MSSKYEEINASLASLALEMIDITEKFNKMGTKEIDTMIASALNGSKRINSTMKKILDLDTLVIALRQAITKANLQAMISKDSDSDPVEPKSEESKADEPKVVEPKAQEPKAESPKAEPKEEKKKGRKPKSDEDILKKAEPMEKDEPKAKAEPKEEKKAKAEPKEEKKAKAEPKEEKKVKDEPKAKAETKEEPPSETTDDKEPLHLKRKNIPKHIKTLVWGKYIGNDKPESKCYSCRHERIDIRNFHCGHVIAEAKGGSLMLDNLRPICAPCNGSMGTMSMNEFTQQFFGWTV